MEDHTFVKPFHRIVQSTWEQMSVIFERMESADYELICATQNGETYTLFFRKYKETDDADLETFFQTTSGVSRPGW